MAPGLIMLVLGLFVLLRTVVKDDTGKNLPAHLLSL